LTNLKTDHANTDAESPEEGAVTEHRDERSVARRQRPSALMLFEIVRRDGAEELTRPTVSLFWSGVAAGLAISFSLAGVGMIYASTEAGPTQTLLMPLGYVIGFLIVVFGRLQLFTENTIAAILPLAADFTGQTLKRVLKLNAVVLTANLVGAVVAALAIALTPILEPDHLAGVQAVATKAMDRSAVDTLILGIPAGFLVAAMVWMMPAAKGAEVFVVTAIIYTLGLGEFAHVIVGSVEAGVLIIAGQANPVSAVFGFVLPALIGNIIGGTALFAVLAYAQIRDEVRRGRSAPKV
jgi:formate/nitrite transporter FocA (FNT family)